MRPLRVKGYVGQWAGGLYWAGGLPSVPCDLGRASPEPQLPSLHFVDRVWKNICPVYVSVFHIFPLLFSSSFLNSDDRLEVTKSNCVKPPSWLCLLDLVTHGSSLTTRCLCFPFCEMAIKNNPKADDWREKSAAPAHVSWW